MSDLDVTGWLVGVLECAGQHWLAAIMASKDSAEERRRQVMELERTALLGQERPRLRPFPVTAWPLIERLEERQRASRPLSDSRSEKVIQAQRDFDGWWHVVHSDFAAVTYLVQHFGVEDVEVQSLRSWLIAEYRRAMGIGKVPDTDQVERALKRLEYA